MYEPESVIPFFRFESLRVYAKALGYFNWLHKTFESHPDLKQSFLTNSFLKSASKISLNLVEGSTRNKPQFVYYLKLAKSAIRDCVVFTEFAAAAALFNEDDKEYSRNTLIELIKMIGSLSTSLQKPNPNSTYANDENENGDADIDFDSLIP